MPSLDGDVGGIDRPPYANASFYPHNNGYVSFDENNSYDSYDAYPKYDYSVLAVALITMGLIVPVELVRHRIDARAAGRPFARTVLDFLYSEREYLSIT